MKNKTRLTAKTQKEHRDALAKKQNYKCELCGIDLNTINQKQWHLDHDHTDGHCRAILCAVCNGKEGAFINRAKVITNWSQTGLTPSEYLRKLADYWEENFDDQPIHETHAREQVKRFKRLNAKQQNKLISDNGIVPGKNTTERSKQARKLLKEGKIWL